MMLPMVQQMVPIYLSSITLHSGFYLFNIWQIIKVIIPLDVQIIPSSVSGNSFHLLFVTYNMIPLVFE